MKISYRSLSFFLVLIMLLSMVAALPAAAAGPVGVSGTGTQSDPYLIKTVQDLEAVRTYVNETTKGINCYYKLNNDIDMQGATWSTSIGAGNSHHFKGTFDGDGHTISNFNLTAGGFFNLTNGSTIKNLTLSNVSATFTATKSGIFVNQIYLANDTTFENCHTQGTITISDTVTSNPWCSGFAGYLSRATSQEVAAALVFKNCSTDVVISGVRKNATSGFLGTDAGVGSVSFINCNASLTMETTPASIEKVGGFMAQPSSSHTFEGCTASINVGNEALINGYIGGFISSASVTQTFKNCTAILNVNNQNVTSNIGGFLGAAGTIMTFENCVSKGNVLAVNATNVGGFIGHSNSGAKTSLLTNCANLADLTALQNIAGIIGHSGNTYFNLKGCYNAGAITSVSEDLSCVYVAHFVGRGESNAYSRVAFDGCYVLSDVNLSGGRIYCAEVVNDVPSTPITNHCLIAYGGTSRQFELDADKYGLNDPRFDVVSTGEFLMKAARGEVTCFNGLSEFVTVGFQDAIEKNSDGTYNVRLIGAIAKSKVNSVTGFNVTLTSGSKTATTKTEATKAYKAIIENGNQVNAPEGYYFITLILNNFNDVSHSIDFSIYLDEDDDSVTGILGTHKDAQTYSLGDKHSMLLYYGVTVNGFLQKCRDIEKNKYVLYTTRTDANGNIFTTYHRSTDNVVKHVYWIKYSGEMRVVTGQNVTTSQLPVTSTERNNSLYDHVLVHQLSSLNSKKANGGLGFILRLNDGRFIVIDGGNWSSSYTDNATEIYDFLTSNLHSSYSGKVVIAAWIFTHTHTDHSDAFLGFSQKYGKSSNITIERVLYNACNVAPETTYASFEATKVANAITNNFTDAKRPTVIKPLAGQIYKFSKTSIEILYTMADFMPNVTLNEADASTTISSDGNGNNHTMVFMVDLLSKSGTDDNLMITGDMTSIACNELCARYGSALKAKYLQVSHHGFAIDPASNLYCRRDNATMEFYSLISPTVAFWPTTNVATQTDIDLNNGVSAFDRIKDIEANAYLRTLVTTNILASDTSETRTVKIK